MSAIFSETNRADQIEIRGLTRFQQITLGLIEDDLDIVMINASLSDVNARDTDGNTVLSWSARCANDEATRALLRRGADHRCASRFGSTALHYAAGARSPSCLLPLLEAGADANRENNCLKETPLHVAALRHDEAEDFMGPLILHDADVNACDHEGSSVLAFAVQANHCRSAKFLLDHGADINRADNSGLTPIGVAVLYNHYKVLTLLLQRGATISCITESGETLLHLCAQYGDLESLLILAEAGLGLLIHSIDGAGRRAYDYALLRDEYFINAFDKFFAPSPKLPTNQSLGLEPSSYSYLHKKASAEEKRYSSVEAE